MAKISAVAASTSGEAHAIAVVAVAMTLGIEVAAMDGIVAGLHFPNTK